MAEYIEREEVIRRLELSIKSWSADCNSNAEIMVTAYQDILERVKHIPTADVVPKSEVEELIRKQIDLHEECTGLKKAKQEVAREIFEEIENRINRLQINYLEELNKEHIKDTPLYDRCSGILFALQRGDDYIAELKKKYTKQE